MESIREIYKTDVAILEVFSGRPIEIVWEPETFLPKHPNALKFEAFGGEQQPESV